MEHAVDFLLPLLHRVFAEKPWALLAWPAVAMVVGTFARWILGKNGQRLAIVPRTKGGLLGIATGPFVHANVAHPVPCQARVVAGGADKAVLATHIANPWDLAMVDMNIYRRSSGDAGYLMIPELRGVLVEETRIKVVVEGAASVQIERAEPGISARQEWDEERWVLAHRTEPSPGKATSPP